MDSSVSQSTRSPGMKRRDFLAGVGLASLGMPLLARAAFAQDAPAAPPADTTIARLAIYPAIGISRVGTSAEWFLAPEVPGLPPLRDGRYKDAAWKDVGDEVTSLLTTEEYDSARRTTFNAFYTSPTVIAAMHEALGRLGLPQNATILEPGCGTGNFMSLGSPSLRFVGIELDLLSNLTLPAL